MRLSGPASGGSGRAPVAQRAKREHEARSSRRRNSISLLVAAAIALAQASVVVPAFAAPTGTAGTMEVEVLALSSNDAVDEAAALTDAFKHALIEANGISDNGKSHALEAEALTVGCDDPMAPACAPKIAAKLKIDKFIYGAVKKTPPNKLTVTLHFFNNGDIKTVVKTYDAGPVSKDGASPELKALALDALYALTGGPPKAKVEVTVMGPGSSGSGDLFEGDTKVGHVEGGKAEVELPAGPHTLELRMPGFGATSGSVDVSTDGGTLKLAPIALAPSKPFDWQLYSGIGAIAVGAVFIGVGVATSLSIKDSQDDPTFTEYRKRFPSSVTDTCGAARSGDEGRRPVGGATLAPTIADLCDTVSHKQKMQFVWYGLGAVFAGGGVILLATDKNGSGSEAAKTASASSGVTVRVQPSFGAGMGSLSLVGAF